jgi:ABC-2 type transport system permease protein
VTRRSSAAVRRRTLRLEPARERGHLRGMNVMSKAAAAVSASSPTPPQPRVYHGVNWTGLKTLYLKEVRRFWKVGTQTVAAPVVTTLLYMMIFVVALQGSKPNIEGVPVGAFVGPGLIMMAVLNNGFANASSSIIQAKIMGTAPDFLTPPLSPFELSAGFGLGAATRGIVVGLVTALAVWPFSHFEVAQLWAILFFGVSASLIMGFVGVIAGLWSEKFDQLAAVTNFVVMPMTFLSGTFYSVQKLPPFFAGLSRFNPMFYLIDGFRFGFIGHSDGDLRIGVAYTLALLIALALTSWALFRSGWRLKT